MSLDRRGYLYGLLRQEARQRIEEGCHREEIQSILDRVSESSVEEELLEAFARMEAAQVDPGFPFHEPTAWEELTAVSPGFAAPSGTDPRSLPGLEDRMLGAWFGRCAGCALGKPLERPTYMNWHGDVAGWQGVRIYLKAAGAWPLDWYVPQIEDVGDYGVRCPASTRGRIAYMETDDDIRYTVLGLTVLERHGAGFTTGDVARAWWNTLPIGQTFTAERQAYRNLADVMDSGEVEANLDYIRGHLNPFREWIGAQIRADGWAYGAAGRPARAAEFAYRDAALSHVKNGIYGEMLFAAAIAAAFETGSPLDALREGLRYIPSRSRLARDVADAIELGLSITDLDALHETLWKKWGHYDGVHTNNNAALVAAAIAWGGDDFEKTIVCAVTGGWDTDCNGATAGSLWGAAFGYGALPEKWTAPLNDTLYAAIPGFHPIAISECARRSAAVALKIAEA